MKEHQRNIKTHGISYKIQNPIFEILNLIILSLFKVQLVRDEQQKFMFILNYQLLKTSLCI